MDGSVDAPVDVCSVVDEIPKTPSVVNSIAVVSLGVEVVDASDGNVPKFVRVAASSITSSVIPLGRADDAGDSFDSVGAMVVWLTLDLLPIEGSSCNA